MITFVILHYKNMNDTIECIKSIKKLKGSNDCSIVVVDNGSCSNSDANILKKYTPDLILNKDNLGFAKGNNMGCQYAIKKYKPEFLIVTNNDIIINQNNFLKKIKDLYLNYPFDAVGPKINTNGGESVNPFPAYKTLEEVNKAITNSEKLIRIYQNIFLRNLLVIYIKTKKFLIKPKSLENGEQQIADVSLHGCFIIFSKKYYKKYKDIFYNETFLYHEEEFLEYRRKKDKLMFLYEPSLEVFHKEGASLNLSFKGQNYEKKIFREKEILKSLRLLKSKLKAEIVK